MFYYFILDKNQVYKYSCDLRFMPANVREKNEVISVQKMIQITCFYLFDVKFEFVSKCLTFEALFK